MEVRTADEWRPYRMYHRHRMNLAEPALVVDIGIEVEVGTGVEAAHDIAVEAAHDIEAEVAHDIVVAADRDIGFEAGRDVWVGWEWSQRTAFPISCYETAAAEECAR